MTISPTSTVEDLIAAGALFVSSHSGGKDSQAQLIRLLEVVPKNQLLVCHASLGAMEWPGAMELARARQRRRDHRGQHLEMGWASLPRP